MKVLLALSRFEPNANPPLGLAYIASSLRKAGVDVEILDPSFEGREFAEARIKKPDYDILGFSCFTMNYNVSKELAALAKSCNKKVLTVFGGPHPSIVPEQTIRDKEVDVVCLGEGEISFVELVRALESGSPLSKVGGIWFKKGKKVVKTPVRKRICDLDALPFPARDLLPMEKYLNSHIGRGAWAVKAPSTTMIVGRGCPFNCTYCSTKLIFGKSVRFRSAKNVADEIALLVKEYGIRGIAFVDDTFTISRAVVDSLCSELIKRKLGVQWACHTRVDTLSPELLKKMRKAGCNYITLGVESGNQEVLDKFVKKGIKLENVEKVFKWTKQAGIISGAYFILGIPGETKENMRETIDFAKKIRPDVVNFNVVRPLPKTEMYELAERFGTLNVKSWDDFNFDAKPIFESREWSSEYVEKMCEKAYSSFYFSPSFMLRQALSIRSFDDLRKIYNGFLMILKRTFFRGV